LNGDQQNSDKPYRILIVDDNEANVDILEARLRALNYETVSAYDGEEVKADPSTQMIPVIMVTAKADQEDIARGFEMGADDYLTKPFQQMELMARVRSMLRIRKSYLDILDLNNTLEQRVREQVAEIDRIGRLKRYFSPQLLQSLTSDEAETIMGSHRREITVSFLDLRGFTSFSERSEPEEVMLVLEEFHRTAGAIIFRHEGTIERFAGDGIMVFFGDPMPMKDHPSRAIRMALDLQKDVGELSKDWQRFGFDLSLGIGIATGFATLGTIGFEGRLDYAAIGNVTNLASRLCEQARGEQILISHRTALMAEDEFAANDLGTIDIRGFSTPVPIYEVQVPISGGDQQK
jgi:class 3 adenylate cyclase